MKRERVKFLTTVTIRHETPADRHEVIKDARRDLLSTSTGGSNGGSKPVSAKLLKKDPPTSNDLFDALRELTNAVGSVCSPLLTASDGGAMWCTMRDRPGAKNQVDRLKTALRKAVKLLQAKHKS